MMPRWRFAMLALHVHAGAYAGFGAMDIGFGSPSKGMAGADAAVTGNPLGWNINPATQAWSDGRSFEISVDRFQLGPADYRDDLNTPATSDLSGGTVFGFGWSQRQPQRPISWGFALAVQGGSGFEFRKLTTRFGNGDILEAQFAVARLAGGVAWQANDQLSVGASVAANYAVAEQKLFPNTSFADQSNPQSAFFGLSIDGLAGWSPSWRVGLMYRPVSRLSLGLTYGSRTEFVLDGGRAQVNMEAVGAGRVRYEAAEVRGFTLPQTLTAGLAWAPADSWLLAFDVGWLDWSSAFSVNRVKLSQPGQEGVPSSISVANPINWRDQYSFALGMQFIRSENLTLMAGLAYARRPVRRATLTPVLMMLSEWHIAAGVDLRLSPRWALASTLLYVPPVHMRSTSPDLPLGSNAQMEMGAAGLLMSISRRW